MKNKVIVTIILMAMVLSACGTASAANQSATTSKAKSFAGQTEMIVSIFKLEGTDQAVTAKQASELLPLWEVIKTLSSSDTAAQAEIDAAARQIKETLTPSQLQAITAMKLTDQDVQTFEQSVNSNTFLSSGKKSSSSSGKSNSGFGGPPDGGGPGGDALGGVLTGVSQLGSTTSSTKSAQTSAVVSNQIPSALLDAMIQLMKNRAKA